MLMIDKPMPEGCDVCPLMYDYFQCRALPEGCDDDNDFYKCNFDWTKRPSWCPLVEINDHYEIQVQRGLSTWRNIADKLLKGAKHNGTD